MNRYGFPHSHLTHPFDLRFERQKYIAPEELPEGAKLAVSLEGDFYHFSDILFAPSNHNFIRDEIVFTLKKLQDEYKGELDINNLHIARVAHQISKLMKENNISVLLLPEVMIDRTSPGIRLKSGCGEQEMELVGIVLDRLSFEAEGSVYGCILDSTYFFTSRRLLPKRTRGL